MGLSIGGKKEEAEKAYFWLAKGASNLTVLGTLNTKTLVQLRKGKKLILLLIYLQEYFIII